MHLHVDRLHHHDRVIHHDTDSEHQGEQSQHIDRETQHLHKEERTDQRYRNGDSGYQRRPEILQEKIHHDKYQDKRLQQGLEHDRYGSVQETGYVVRDIIFHTRGKRRFLQFLHLRLDLLDHLTGVRARTLLDHDRGRGLSVRHGDHIIILGIKLDRSHVFQAKHGTVRQGFQDDLAILLRRAELTAILQDVLQLLRDLVGTDTRLTRRRLDILRADRLRNLLRRHIISRQSVRVQPYTHRIVAATHDLHESHAVDALQLTQDIDIGEIIYEFLRMGTIRAHDVQVHQHTVHLLLRDHAGTDHLFRKLIQHGGHTVLHIHGSYVRVGTDLEIDRSQGHTVVRTNRGHIGHSGHAVDGTLQRGRHRFRHHVGVRSGIRYVDRDNRLGTISGNWVIGKELIASNPKKTITTEITPDKIGRLINISNIGLTYYSRFR